MKYTIKNLETKYLKEYFGVSMSVQKNDNFLSFEVNNKEIKSTVENDAESILKTWNLNLSEISESNDLPNENIRCVLYKGNEFTKKILGYFGEKLNLTFSWDDDLKLVKSVELYRLDDKGRKSLSVVVVCASKENFKEYDDEVVETLFYPTQGDLMNFTIKKAQVDELRKLSEISSNPEQHNDYVRFYSEGGVIKVTDKIFDTILSENADITIPNGVEIDKELFGLIESDDYTVYLNQPKPDVKLFRLESKSKKIITTIMLLTKAMDDEYDDMFDDEDDFLNSL